MRHLIFKITRKRIVGMLACKDVGKGKLPDPEVLLDYIAMELAREKTLAGVRVTVTAGPTQESLDPVRYLTNHSSTNNPG